MKGYFDTQYGLDYIRLRAKELAEGISKVNYGDYNNTLRRNEYDLCSYEYYDYVGNTNDAEEVLSVYLGVYNDEFCWTFSIYGVNRDCLYITPDSLELDSLEALKMQAKLLLDNWNKDRLESIIE